METRMARISREHKETEQFARQALGEGMFAAAIRQAKCAARNEEGSDDE